MAGLESGHEARSEKLDQKAGEISFDPGLNYVDLMTDRNLPPLASQTQAEAPLNLPNVTIDGARSSSTAAGAAQGAREFFGGIGEGIAPGVHYHGLNHDSPNYQWGHAVGEDIGKGAKWAWNEFKYLVHHRLSQEGSNKRVEAPQLPLE
jgi:hypothetical protein